MQAGMHWTSSCWQGWQVGIAGRRTASPNGCSKPQLLMPLCHGRCRHRLHSLLPRPACTACSHHHGCRWLHFWQALLQVTVQDVAAVAAVAAPDINGLPTCGVIQHNGAGHPPGAGRHSAEGPRLLSRQRRLCCCGGGGRGTVACVACAAWGSVAGGSGAVGSVGRHAAVAQKVRHPAVDLFRGVPRP